MLELVAGVFDGFVDGHADPSFGDEHVGHRRRPVAGVDRADAERVGDVPPRRHRVRVAVASRLEAYERLEQRQELLDRADALGATRRVGGLAGHDETERQRTRVGRDEIEAGGLGDHAGVGRPAAGEGAVGAETAVLLSQNGGHEDVAPELYA